MSSPTPCLPPRSADPPAPAAGVPGTIAAILVNYNSGSQLSQALQSLAAQSRPPDEIVVVDNGSTDGSLGLVDWQRHPAIRLVCLSDNRGFAAASNAAARIARAEWLAMLNCDAAAAPDWLEALSAAAARHPDCAIFASAQALMDRPAMIDGAGDVYSVTGLAWRGGHGRPVAGMPREGRCFAACAAGAFISRRVFQELGGFEESFFCYLEDVDFAYRARLAGHDCLFVPSARILHRGGGCSGPVSDWTMRISSRNRLHLYLRNTPLLLLLATWPLFGLGLGLSVLQGLRHRRGRAVLGGLAEGLRQLPATLGQRRQLAPPLLPPRQIWRVMSWNPFGALGRRPRIRALPAGAPCPVPVPAESGLPPPVPAG
ncbi:glycosyltransferase family 2 protein [Poseidonocella sp. HB161398]|uniref:glycosyltransferase family 2 protein n=1 Tax=Poseidonocella sp. HB161398 TaxID=2320855 RepID=UPI0011083043|nr:glycosyltransferase family 2 protein [Poseidonocella sp. HB161398]